tara:strand:- start:384 stop:668 length:285 start_codon:yes stop_codon:yes gene_type:complete
MDWLEEKRRYEVARKRSQSAFERAIASGRLSDNEDSIRYAGDWMFMYTSAENVDMFKHRETRKYLPLEGQALTKDFFDVYREVTSIYDMARRAF